ncbi:MAG: hypothetical protein K1X53_09590 [Candidatus Sumerlaeaceae bacterium]|nr:hypothetical protein [Candidatus Sumerlaeaceae bacterium]
MQPIDPIQVNVPSGDFAPYLGIIIMLLLLAVVSGLLFRRACGLSRPASVGAAILVYAITILYLTRFLTPSGHFVSRVMANAHTSPLWFFVCLGAIPILGIPFMTMLVRKWMGIGLKPEEQLIGVAGLRAWLSLGRIVWIVSLTLCLSLWAFPCLLGALLAYPLVRWLLGVSPVAGSDAPNPAASTVVDFGPEREKILTMVAENRISPQEGAELLNALAASQATQRPAPIRLTVGQKQVLVGAVLVLVGFFLPWLTINLGNELTRVANGFSMNPQQQLSQLAGAMGIKSSELPSLPTGFMEGKTFHPPKMETPNLYVAGGDLQHGIGWMILILSVGVALIPFLPFPPEKPTRRFAEVGAQVFVGFLLLYIMTSSFRFLSYGFVVVLLGFALQIVGSVRQWRTSGAPTFATSTAVRA